MAIQLSRFGLDRISMSEFDGAPIAEEKVIALIWRAFELRINCFNTANLYGYRQNDVVIDKTFWGIINTTTNRSDPTIATKCGKNKNCITAQIALAWLMHQNSAAAISGITKLFYLATNVESQTIKLNREKLKMLNRLESMYGYCYTKEAIRAYGFHDELV